MNLDYEDVKIEILHSVQNDTEENGRRGRRPLCFSPSHPNTQNGTPIRRPLKIA